MPALQSSIEKGWRDEGRGLEEREREKHFREGGAGLNRGRKRMLPLLISKRESFLMLGCLSVLAANATRGTAMKFGFLTSFEE